jgi:hypothetical protein
MIFSLIEHVILNFIGENCLLLQLFIKAIVKFLESVHFKFELLLTIEHPLLHVLELLGNQVLLLRVLGLNLTDHDLVVLLATELEQNGEDLPDGTLQGVLVVGVVQSLVEHLEEAEGVHEQSSVDSVDVGVGELLSRQLAPSNPIPLKRVLAVWLDEDAWDLHVLGVDQSVVQPGLDDTAAEVGLGHFVLGQVLDPPLEVEIHVVLWVS